MEINEVKEWAEKSTLMLVNGTVCRRGNCVQYGSLMLVRLIPERDETIRFD
jgi:hypothetical protein